MHAAVYDSYFSLWHFMSVTLISRSIALTANLSAIAVSDFRLPICLLKRRQLSKSRVYKFVA